MLILAVVLGAICVALILVGRGILKSLSSIKLVLLEIRDTHRKELLRTRLALTRNLGELAWFLDPKYRREHRQRQKDYESECDKVGKDKVGKDLVAPYDEHQDANPERKAEMHREWELKNQAREQREQEEEARRERLEREYLEREYPPRND